ncbi:MAG: peptidoglycan-binding domain-containing protein [Cyanobacteria bacterium P01_D01_bin.36]
MKQFAVRSLGLGVTLMTLAQLPVLAISRVPSLSVDSSVDAIPQPSLSIGEQPQLLAQVGLTRRSLSPGDDGADVRALQRYLSRNGLYSFNIDGIYGSDTANSVATYQRIRDLPATGVADEETLRDMEFEFLPGSQTLNSGIPQPPRSSGSFRSGSLGVGSTGTDVIALQQRLNELGIPVFVDGDYGFETQQGVRTYQRVQGLPVTGNADSDTLRAMGISSSVAASPFRYVAAIIADSSELATVQTFFADAYVDRDRRGEFINIGNFADRFPAEAKVDAAKARGFSTRVIYRRRGLFN